MKLIHTADWHLGRRLKGVDRTPEIEDALNAMLHQAMEDDVDAVLIAGDIFDAPNPPAEAERVAYRFFSRLSDAGIPAVMIAGNHDSATRFDGVSNLLSLAGVQALGRVRLANAGGIVNIRTRSGDLCVGALPFASERRLLSADELWRLDDVEQRASYRETIAMLLKNLADAFSGHSVNVLMAHLALENAKLAHSEVPFYTRDAYSLAEAVLPSEAQYIALGHIHTRQEVKAPAPTYYSGSLIQVDFGEAGEEKGYNLITVEPGRPPKVEFRALPLTRRLEVVSCDAGNLEDVLAESQDEGCLYKVIVKLEAPVVGLADRVRKVCRNALQIEPRYPHTSETAAPLLDPEKFSPKEAYLKFYGDRVGAEPSAAVVAAFETLFEEMSHASA
jgi:exonuclease SbcD